MISGADDKKLQKNNPGNFQIYYFYSQICKLNMYMYIRVIVNMLHCAVKSKMTKITPKV